MLISMLMALNTASAYPTFADSGFVVVPTAGTYTEGGVGAPTVAYDTVNGEYVMYFEYKINALPSTCATAYGIGRATSVDGLTWVKDASPVITPDPANSLAKDHCVVSQPAVVYDEDTGVWHMLYGIAGKKASAAATTNTDYGIAYATSTDGVTFTEVNFPAIPKTGTKAPSMASAVIFDDTLVVVYVDYPNLKQAEMPLSTGVWTYGNAAVDKTKLTWTSLWAFSPALVCDGLLDNHGWPDNHGVQYAMLFGGDTTTGTRSLGFGGSPDANTWFVGLDLVSSPAGSLNHWDILQADGDYLMWYSKDYTATTKGIGLAHADEDGSGGWNTASNKYCPLN